MIIEVLELVEEHREHRAFDLLDQLVGAVGRRRAPALGGAQAAGPESRGRERSV